MTNIEIKLLSGDTITWRDPDEVERVEGLFETYLLQKNFVEAFLEDGSNVMIPVSSIAYVSITKEDENHELN